jgi:ethanolamine utilization protein EutM
MANRALGLVEVVGLVGAIEATDAAGKAAAVDILEIEYADAGICTVKIVGDVADVMTAVDAASAAAGRVGQLRGKQVIARPDEQTERLFESKPVRSAASGAWDVMSEAARKAEGEETSKGKKASRKKK